jgi:hypothetical protein
MSLPCRSAEDTIESCIKRERKQYGGQIKVLMHSKSLENFGENLDRSRRQLGSAMLIDRHLIPEQKSAGRPRTFAMQKKQTLPGKSHARFTLKSGPVQCNGPCPLWAKSGHRQTKRPPCGGRSPHALDGLDASWLYG